MGAEECAVDTREEGVGIGKKLDGAVVGLDAILASRVSAHIRGWIHSLIHVEVHTLPSAVIAQTPVLQRSQRVGAALGLVLVIVLFWREHRAGEAPTTGVALRGHGGTVR